MIVNNSNIFGFMMREIDGMLKQDVSEIQNCLLYVFLIQLLLSIVFVLFLVF